MYTTHILFRCVFQMLAVFAMYGKIPARLKVRNLFDMFDLDLDGNLNSSETIMMLRFVGDRDTFGLLPAIYCMHFVECVCIFNFIWNARPRKRDASTNLLKPAVKLAEKDERVTAQGNHRYIFCQEPST